MSTTEETATTTTSITAVNTPEQPWIVPNFKYGSGVAALHREIEHFYNYIVSTPTECAMRIHSIYRIESVILSIWPHASVEVFGSCRTGLHLPMSDIDIVVNNLHMTDEPLQHLKNILIMREVADNVKVLDKASVPVVKFTDRESQVKFDISFNTMSGVDAAELVKSFTLEYPELPKLVLVLKQFLMQNGLNEVYKSGGISSYALIMMCISFLQQQKFHLMYIKKHNKLGKLLLKFLDFYGRRFDYLNYGITVRGDGGYVEKSALQRNFGDNNWISVLTIEDPITPSNDIGKSSYGALYAKKSFEMAFHKLSKLVDLDASNRTGSILSSIIEIPQQVIAYRHWVESNFSNLTTFGMLPMTGHWIDENYVTLQMNVNGHDPKADKENAINVNTTVP